MRKIFDPENPFMQTLSRLTDLMILSICWSVCSVPIVTIGPATAALYYVVLKMVEESESSIFRSFFRSFRRNLRQGVLLTLIVGLIAGLLIWNREILMNFAPDWGNVARILYWVLGAVLVMGGSFLFPLLARYENTVLGTLRNAFLMAFAYLPRGIAMGILNLCPLAVFLFAPDTFYRIFPVWLIFAPGLIAYLCACLLKKPFGLSSRSDQEQN